MTLSQMYDHVLNPVKGWPHKAAVDKAAEAAEGVTITTGCVVHLDSNGDFALGVSGTTMGIVILSDDNIWDYEGNMINGARVGLVCGYCYEVETTEYVTSNDYSPNDLLTSDTSGGDAGKVTLASYPTDCVCGVVSDGVVQVKTYGNKNLLRFWTTYLPAHTHS